MNNNLTKHMAETFSILSQALDHINTDPTYGKGNRYHIASVDRLVVWITDGKLVGDVGEPFAYTTLESLGGYIDIADEIFIDIDVDAREFI